MQMQCHSMCAEVRGQEGNGPDACHVPGHVEGDNEGLCGVQGLGFGV